MRKFDYKTIPAEIMNYEIMNLVSAIHEYKGKQELFIEAKPDVLEAMLEIAKIQQEHQIESKVYIHQMSV